MKQAEWYVDWFNSPYYHLLYNNRNYNEAQTFIENLFHVLKLKHGEKVWDLACGKGRHALALNKVGLDVTGTDLSVNSIREASLNSNAFLRFEVHDMRESFVQNQFSAVFNLFTSFGYFKTFQENQKVFQNVAASLVSGGHFVLDFFNSHKVINNLRPDYVERRGPITFEIQKTIRDKAIVKHIEFSDGGKDYFFEESVALLDKKDFVEFANGAGLRLSDTFGNYQLQNFDEEHSDRLILIFEK